MAKDYIEMGKQIKIYCNDKVIYNNKELDADKFIIAIKELVNSGYVLNFYEALSGFTLSNAKTNEFYHLKFCDLVMENYKNSKYTRLTNELKNLLLLQEQNKFSIKIKNISVKRLIELEKLLENNKLENITNTELYFINLAKLMPLNQILADLDKYSKEWAIIDEVWYTKKLMKKYSCTKEELFDRIYTAHKIRRYKAKESLKLLKDQKKMIKILNKKIH